MVGWWQEPSQPEAGAWSKPTTNAATQSRGPRATPWPSHERSWQVLGPGGVPGAGLLEPPERPQGSPASSSVWRELDLEDPLEEGMATHSSILAWRIAGTGKPGGLPSTPTWPQNLPGSLVGRPWSGPWPSGLCGCVGSGLAPSCPTLCDPIDGSPQGSPVPGILQARSP